MDYNRITLMFETFVLFKHARAMRRLTLSTLSVPSWRVLNYVHDPDAVRGHGHRPTEPLEIQESSSEHPKLRSRKPKRGQESSSEQESGESSSI